MNFCSNCGNEFKETDKFCSNCGVIKNSHNKHSSRDEIIYSDKNKEQNNLEQLLDESDINSTVKINYEGEICSYIGESANGIPNGKGKLYKTGNSGSLWLFYEGDWEDGKPNGIGKEYKEYSNEELRYSGCWKDGRYHGHGVIYLDTKIESQFVNGKISGSTKCYYHDGVNIRISGILNDNNVWSDAKWFHDDGTISYEGSIGGGIGILDDNVMHGWGIRYDEDGNTVCGVWVNDYLIWDDTFKKLISENIDDLNDITDDTEDDDEAESNDPLSLRSAPYTEINSNPFGLKVNDSKNNDPLGLRN